MPASEDSRIPGQLRRPVILVAEANDDVAEILQALRRGVIARLPLGIVVIVPIDVDRRLLVFIVEIRPRATASRSGAARATAGECSCSPGSAASWRSSSESACRISCCRCSERDCSAGPATTCDCASAEEHIANGLAVEQPVVPLVVVAQQAIVAGGLHSLPARGARGCRSAPVSGSKWQRRSASCATSRMASGSSSSLRSTPAPPSADS